MVTDSCSFPPPNVLREEDKNIFDYCRDNNIEYITNAITSQNVDVNIRDEEVSAKLSHTPLVA